MYMLNRWLIVLVLIHVLVLCLNASEYCSLIWWIRKSCQLSLCVTQTPPSLKESRICSHGSGGGNAASPMWSKPKYLRKHWMDSCQTGYRHSCSPDYKPCLLQWSSEHQQQVKVVFFLVKYPDIYLMDWQNMFFSLGAPVAWLVELKSDL